MSRYSKTERVGVNAVERIVVDELEWIFREQPIVDMGIDAHMERVDVGVPTGRLVALQIKTGASHFIEKKTQLIFYGNLAHLDYWTGHSLPVILIAHLPTQNATYWTTVTETNVQRTTKHWKVAIPKANVFAAQTQKALATVFDGSPAQQRLRKLSIHEPLMRHIQNGGKVSVGLEDWINKSLGRTPVKVYIHDEDGTESLSQDWFQYYTGFGMKELAERLFPWASASIDREFYDEHDEIDRSDDFGGPDDEEGGDSQDNGSVYPYAEAAAGVTAEDGTPIYTVSVDEKPGIQALATTAPDLPPVPGKHPTVARDYEYKRMGTASILAGLDLQDGHVTARVERRHRSREFIHLLKELDARYPAPAVIRLILDNHSAHISKETRAFLATRPNRFRYVHTPKHGSWLNLVETLFGKMARTFLRGIRVSSWEELRHRILAGIAEINAAPVVHQWKKFEALDKSEPLGEGI